MTDIRARFHRVDRLQVPDLWSEVTRRANASRPAPSLPSPQGRILRLALLIILLAILASAAIVVVGALRRPPQPDPPASGWIAYRLGDTLQRAQGDIYLTSLDGVPRPLVGTDRDGLEQGCPRFSPDGRYLAYGERVQDDFRRVNPDGSHTLAAAAIVVVEVDGAGTARPRLRVAAGDTEELPCPVWSPDGRALAFLAQEHRVRVARLGGQATDLNVAATGLAWTYDSAAVAIVDRTRTRIVPIHGAEPRLVAEASSDGRNDVFHSIASSPSGPMLAIGGQNFVRVVNYEDGSVVFEEPAMSAGGFWKHGEADWSPDGSRIAWDVAHGLMVRRIGEPAALSRPGPWLDGTGVTFSSASGVRWSLNGTRLMFVGFDERSRLRYAFVSIAADGPSRPIVLSPWTEDQYWANQDGITWQPSQQ